MAIYLSDDTMATLTRPQPAAPEPLGPSDAQLGYTPPPPPAELPISDNLGHVWNSARQAWDNNDGTPYEEIQSYPLPAPASFGGFPGFAGQQVYETPDYQIPPPTVPWGDVPTTISSGQGRFYDTWIPTDTGYRPLPPVQPIEAFPEQTIGPYEGDFEAGRQQFMATLAPPARRLYEQGLDYEDPQLLGIASRPKPASLWDMQKPFDYLAELGADATPLLLGNPLSPVSAPYNAYEALDSRLGLPELPGSLQGSAREVAGDITNPRGALQEFRDRPWYEQLAAGAIYDPTNLIGVGKADDAVRLGHELGQLGDDVLRGARTAGDNLGEALGRRFPQLADEAGSVVPNLIAKPIPGPTVLSPPARDTTSRVGNILHLADPAELGGVLSHEGDLTVTKPYKVQDALNVASNGTRQARSAGARLGTEAENALEVLGPQFRGKDGNWYLRNIAPSPAETQAGMANALAVRVVERPGEYALTPAQRAAVDRLGAITDSVAKERELFGIEVNRLGMDEGQQYIHRLAEKPSEASQAKALVEAKDPRANELQSFGSGGSRLSVAKDKPRVYDDPLEAVKDGVVYAQPKTAIAQNVERGLQDAVNAHVKNLLVPFSETSAMRVPVPLRNEMEGLRTKLAGLQQTAVRLDDRTSGAIKAFLASDNPDLDALRDALDVKVGLSAVGKQGPNFGKDRAAILKTIGEVRQQIRSLAPEWRQAKRIAEVTPAGRRTIPMEVAPALAGRDFDRTTAARIISHYTGGLRIGDRVVQTSIPGARALNAVLTPLNATADLSVTLNQLAMTAASHRKDFLVNFGKSLRDMVGDQNYRAWEAGADVAKASPWVTLSGHGRATSDFEFGSWLERVPGLQQAQRQFSRFGNRMRVDAFNSHVDTLERQGVAVTDQMKEQLGRAVDRATGVATGKAKDFEAQLQFAPNFLRSLVENVTKAAADGTLEGQVARQYFKNYLALGSALVLGAAAYQHRDLADVLTPLDKKAWARGEIRLNPNFMTVRAFGQDIAVFGAYDSLARLATLAGDSVFRSLNERDAMQLFDFVGYAASTKGSPPVKFMADLIKGETFTGQAPLSKEATAQRFMPISAANAVQGLSRGQSGKDVAVDTLLGGLGAKSNPVTTNEKLNELAPNGDFWKLDKTQREAILAAHPDLAQEVQDRDARELKRAQGRLGELGRETNAVGFAQIEAIDKDRLEKEAQAVRETPPDKDPKVFREQVSDINANAALQKRQVDADFKLFKDTGQLPEDPNKRALTEFYDLYDKPGMRLAGGKLNYDAYEPALAALQATWTPEQRAYVEGQQGTAKHVPEVARLYAERKAIEKSGYWAQRDKAWQEAVAGGDLAQYGAVRGVSYDQWRSGLKEQAKQELIAKGRPAEVARVEAEQAVSNYKPVKAFEDWYKKQYLYPWVEANPGMAMVVMHWGYSDFDKKVRDYLSKLGLQ